MRNFSILNFCHRLKIRRFVLTVVFKKQFENFCNRKLKNTENLTVFSSKIQNLALLCACKERSSSKKQEMWCDVNDPFFPKAWHYLWTPPTADENPFLMEKRFLGINKHIRMLLAKELLYSIMAKQILIKELLISHNPVFFAFALLFFYSKYIKAAAEKPPIRSFSYSGHMKSANRKYCFREINSF